MVSLSCAPAYREKGNHKGICLHYITRQGAPSELINFPDYITCILKAHRNLECNDFVPNGKSFWLDKVGTRGSVAFSVLHVQG